MSSSNELKKPKVFSDKLDSLQNQLPPILDDYINSYVLYNANPNDIEYQQTFNGVNGNLNQLNSDLFMLSNDVQTSTDEINSLLFELYNLIYVKFL